MNQRKIHVVEVAVLSLKLHKMHSVSISVLIKVKLKHFIIKTSPDSYYTIRRHSKTMLTNISSIMTTYLPLVGKITKKAY